MDEMDYVKNVQWFLLAGVFSVATSILWYCWHRCSSGIHSCVFQLVAHRLNLAEHKFGTNNIVVISRLLQGVGLDTRRYVSHHDANADTGDAMMVGMLRLPTQSWLLWLLALLDVSHYIWIKDDGLELVFVGPCDIRDNLLRLANVAANRMPEESEIATLRDQIYHNSARDWPCVCFERMLAVVIMTLLVCTGIAFRSTGLCSLAMVWAGCIVFYLARVLVLRWQTQRVLSGCWPCMQSY